MKFLEKDLEQIICESGIDLLNERGLPIDGKFYRQQKIGGYGIADLITATCPFYEFAPQGKFLIKGEITIYELKKEQIGVGAFLQAIGYLNGVKSYLKKRKKDHLFNCKIVLIGKTLDTKGNFCYLPDLLNYEDNFIEFYTYDYGLHGLKFTNHSGYKLINEGF